MSEERAAVAVLNELLEAESGSFAARLAESQPFADYASSEQLAAVRRVAAEAVEHVAWLSETIVALCGVPAPRYADASTADAHYVRVDVLIPRLIRSCERLVETYRSAVGRVAEIPAAAEVISRIQSRHERQRETLVRLQSPATPGTG